MSQKEMLKLSATYERNEKPLIFVQNAESYQQPKKQTDPTTQLADFAENLKESGLNNTVQTKPSKPKQETM